MGHMERKARPFEIKDAREAEGLATILVSVFDRPDEQKDIVSKSAFTRSLGLRTPKLVADHNWTVTHKLGKVLGARATSEGLEVETKFNLEKQLAREIFSDFLFDPEGTEFSFGYEVAPGGAEYKDGFRYLNDVDLFEVGPVLLGMHPDTRLVAAKNTGNTDSTNANLYLQMPSQQTTTNSQGWTVYQHGTTQWAPPPEIHSGPTPPAEPEPIPEPEPSASAPNFDDVLAKLDELGVSLENILKA